MTLVTTDAPEQLRQVYGVADPYTMPSTGKGFCIASLEATPALALAQAGASDAICDGDLSTMVKELDLLDAILRLLRGPRSNPQALARTVRVRFDGFVFENQLKLSFQRVAQAA